MTDRYNSLVVVLEEDWRDDDCEALINAIYQLKGVASVEGNVSDPNTYIAREQAVYYWRKKLIDVLWPHQKKD